MKTYVAFERYDVTNKHTFLIPKLKFLLVVRPDKGKARAAKNS